MRPSTNFNIITNVDDGASAPATGIKVMTGIAVSDEPTVTVDALVTNDTSPELTGTVSDPAATISVTVNGSAYAAINNGDGTWTLADNTIAPVLAEGTYDVAVSADNGEIGTDSTTDELVIGLNDPPVNTVPAAQNINEDVALVFSSGGGNAITIGDIDAGGGDMAVTLNATNGTLTLSGTAGLNFTTGTGAADATMVFTGTIANINAALEGMSFGPTPDFNGAASVQIITDDQGNTGGGGPLTATDTVNITVNAVNDAPTAPDINITTAEDMPYLAALGVNDLLINSNDVDGDVLAVTTTPSVAPSNGLLILSSDGTFTYTPNANFNGTDAFTYEITDGSGGTAQATVMIDVTPVNDAPIVPGSSITLDEDVPYAATLSVDDLLINSVDVDGDTLTVSSTPVVGPTNGVLILGGTGTLTYTPNANFNGTDAFTYEVTDGNGGVAQALVTITVNPINDAPVTSNVALSAQADSAGLIINDGTLLANDTDADGDALALVGLTQPSNGFVSLNPDGTLVYIPTAGFVGVDSFTYTISDPSGAQATGLVVIDVTSADGSTSAIGASNGTNGGDGGGVVIGPVDQGAPTAAAPGAATAPSASASPEPTVSLLVTPDGELSSPDLPEWEREAPDLLLLVGDEMDDSAADVLISQAQSLYSQTVNPLGGQALTGFEFVSLDPASLAQTLDALRRGMSGLENADNVDGAFVVQISTGLGAVLSVGVVSWILRGGTLAATLLSTVPMWKGFDPLPMLLGRRRKKDDEEERDGSDEGETVPEHMQTQIRREQHLESLFSASQKDQQPDRE
jgi:VCBS repeat-containing protein